MTEYLCTDIGRFSWAECWRQSPSLPAFVGMAVMRLTGMRLVPRHGFSSEGPRYLESSAVPEYAARKLTAVANDCIPLGFRVCNWYSSMFIGPVEGYGVTMLHSDGTQYAVAVWVRIALTTPAMEELVFGVTSRLTNDRFLQTTTAKRRLNSPPEFQAMSLPGMSVAGVVDKHCQRLAGVPAEQIVRLDEASVKEALGDSIRRIQQFHRRRGVWVPLSDEDVRRIMGRADQAGRTS